MPGAGTPGQHAKPRSNSTGNGGLPLDTLIVLTLAVNITTRSFWNSLQTSNLELCQVGIDFEAASQRFSLLTKRFSAVKLNCSVCQQVVGDCIYRAVAFG